MVDEVTGKKNQNTGDRFSFTQIDEHDTGIGENKWVRRVLSFITDQHFQDLVNSAFVSQTPKITRFPMADKSQVYEFTFQDAVKQFKLKATKKDEIKYSYVVNGISNNEYIQLGQYQPLEESFLNLQAGTKIFLQSNRDNTLLEILEWK